MCGIAGAIGDVDSSVLCAIERMDAAQAHRGPDASGRWTSDAGADGSRAAFAHRRLAIIDLSDDGRQPMTDAETGAVIVFNGEIYNFQQLREDLQRAGARFRSRSDTEVILKAYARWGEECVSRLRGMFTFALWDPARRICLIARDRFGIKPIYLASVARPGGRTTMLFASELRAILATDLVARSLDPAGLATYVWNGFVVGPSTIVRGIELLPAGTSVVVRDDGMECARRTYWEREPAPARPASRAELEERLAEAVRMHLVSDVPLGIFLSGGIDSSAVAALAVRAGNATVRTFTIGFEEPGYDESAHARAVARALGTEHHELPLSKDVFARDLPAALASLDQPTFDGINTYFVSRAVRMAGLTVALAGTGGDELFGGYRSFRDVPWSASWAARLSWLPRDQLSGAVAAALRALARSSPVGAQTRWGKLADVLAAGGDLVATYQIASGLFTAAFARELRPADEDGLLDNGLPRSVAAHLRELVRESPPRPAVSLLEQWCFLGERLLRDTDSASMASSLEVRVPFLDHEVVATATALAETERFVPLGEKRIVREVALAGLPPALFDRPKSGFVLPIDRWARDTVKDQIAEAFSDAAFFERAGLDPAAARRLWNAFLDRAPGVYWSRLWAIYVLGWWCREHRVSLA